MERVPDGWKIEPLKEVLETLESGSRPKGGVKDIKEGIPSIGGEHLNDSGKFNFEKIKYVSKDFYDSMNRGKIKKNDVLIVKDGATTGKTSFVDETFSYEKSAVNEHVFIARSNKILLPIYLFYYLFSLGGQLQLRKAISGSAQGGINLSILDKVKVIYPDSKEEQKMIVQEIERQITKVDNAINLFKTIKKRLGVYRKAVLKKAFKDFNKKQIKEISKKIQYGLTSRSNKDAKGLRYLRITDIQNGKVNWEQVPYSVITEELDKYILNEGDIVFARTGATVGKSFLIRDIPEKSVFASYLIRVVPDVKQIIPEFLYYYFQSPMYWQEIGFNQRGIGQPNVNGQILSKMRVPLPDIKIQQIIVQEIESKFSVIDKVEEVVNNSLEKAERLKKSILKTAFEGRLIKK